MQVLNANEKLFSNPHNLLVFVLSIWNAFNFTLKWFISSCPRYIGGSRYKVIGLKWSQWNHFFWQDHKMCFFQQVLSTRFNPVIKWMQVWRETEPERLQSAILTSCFYVGEGRGIYFCIQSEPFLLTMGPCYKYMTWMVTPLTKMKKEN